MDVVIVFTFFLIVVVMVITIYNRLFYRGGSSGYSMDIDEEDEESSPYDRDKLKPISSKLPPPKEGTVKEGIVFYSYSGGNYRICPRCESENTANENMCRICGNRFR